MAKQNRSQQHNRKQAKPGRRRGEPLAPFPTLAERMALRKPPTQYGPPITILEDESKNTFEYKRGAWVPHPRSIADCKTDCLVKELPQKVNKMTRYEVRVPLPE